jgi:hypothetical protein
MPDYPLGAGYCALGTARLSQRLAPGERYCASVSHGCLEWIRKQSPDLLSISPAGWQQTKMARLKGAFDYCDGVYSGFTDAHFNDPADFRGANHDALHYGNLVTYLRLNGLVPSGGWFSWPSDATDDLERAAARITVARHQKVAVDILLWNPAGSC